ncbi:MAG: type I 3-dehydroquinate dehydratase [Ruminococcus sp.]|jgi:3-dehydroquinate dehydratase-1
MVKPVKIRNLLIGKGIPKICVPITGGTKKEIEDQAGKIAAVVPDLVEWRADHFGGVEDMEKVREILSTLRGILREIPILFTFRRKEEGGVRSITTKDYVNLNQNVSKWGLADAVDVELCFEKNGAKPLIAAIHGNDCKAVCSNHHFDRTPDTEEMFSLLNGMEEAGADILKIAVMPQNPEDVLRLLYVTYKTGERSSCPLISMAMGGVGALSRLSGESFGSSVTFAAVGDVSAPGQLPMKDMRQALAIIHRALQ